MNHQLSWGLVIATYQREQILPLCLKLAVEQTRKPVEIIVIDASENWESTRDKVFAEIAIAAPAIRWVYTSAHKQGLPLQRNQGLDLATADVVFLLDDDSLMSSECAEEIMRVYEADQENRVMGVQAALAEQMPSDILVKDDRKPVGWYRDQWIPVVTLAQRFIWKHIFLMDSEMLCVPYYGSFPDHQAPEPIKALGTDEIRLFHGCRMTFRREIIVKEKFEPLLLYYALNEDMDASYRVSRHGVLLESEKAKLHHFQSNSGRLSRFIVTALSALNQAVCIRRYSNDLKRDRGRFYWLTARRVLAEFCKDALSRRWTFPQLRGILVAFRYAPMIFSLPEAELAEWYPNLQKEFVVSGKPPASSKRTSVQAMEV